MICKRPETFGKSMIFPAMVETYAILALLVSILSISRRRPEPVIPGGMFRTFKVRRILL